MRFKTPLILCVFAFAISGCGGGGSSSGSSTNSGATTPSTGGTTPSTVQGYNLYVTANTGGTPSYVSALNIDCGSGNGGTKCSDLNVSSSQDLFAMAVPGVDANGNYDTDISWTGCPEVSQVYTCQIGRGPVFPTGNMYITATFTKVYGLPSNIGVTVSGSGQGTVTAVDTAQNWVINCSKSGGTCSATINSGKSSYTTLYATPSSGSNFASWTGCPNPNGATCQIPAGQNVNVTATFQ